MEPENTPLEKENHLPNHHFHSFSGSMLIFRGVLFYFARDRGIQASCITINTITTSIPTQRLWQSFGSSGVPWCLNRQLIGLKNMNSRKSYRCWLDDQKTKVGRNFNISKIKKRDFYAEVNYASFQHGWSRIHTTSHLPFSAGFSPGPQETTPRRWLMALHVQSCGTQEGMDRSTSGRHALIGSLDVVMMDLPQDSTHSNGLVEHLKPPQKMDGFFCEKNLGPSSLK